MAIKILRLVLAYLLWLIVAALGIWLLLEGRDDFLGFLSVYYVKDSLTRAWQVRFWDKFFVITAGLAWLALVLVAEYSFRQGALHGGLLKRVTRIAGPLILLVFLVDFGLLWLQGIGTAGSIRWLILAGELLVGIALTVLGYVVKLPGAAKPGMLESGG